MNSVELIEQSSRRRTKEALVAHTALSGLFFSEKLFTKKATITVTLELLAGDYYTYSSKQKARSFSPYVQSIYFASSQFDNSTVTLEKAIEELAPIVSKFVIAWMQIRNRVDVGGADWRSTSDYAYFSFKSFSKSQMQATLQELGWSSKRVIRVLVPNSRAAWVRFNDQNERWLAQFNPQLKVIRSFLYNKETKDFAEKFLSGEVQLSTKPTP